MEGTYEKIGVGTLSALKQAYNKNMAAVWQDIRGLVDSGLTEIDVKVLAATLKSNPEIRDALTDSAGNIYNTLMRRLLVLDDLRGLTSYLLGHSIDAGYFNDLAPENTYFGSLPVEGGEWD